MNVMVTGGAGYIGSHACQALAAAGHLPVVLDNLSTGHRASVAWGPLLEADTRDTLAVTEALRAHRIDAVIHFAASTYVGDSVTRPDLYWHNNVGGTLSLLAAMRDAEVKRIVFSSTCATFGLPQTVTLAEDHPQHPVNPYGSTKLACERMLREHQAAFKMRCVVLRYFNAAGADPSGRLGEQHEPETHLIPVALQAAQEGHELTINGTDWPTPDKTCLRDYVHVADLADAHVRALAHLDSADFTGFDSFNLGSGRGFSVREVLAAVEQVTQTPLRIRTGPRRQGDPARLVANSTRARQVLGWQTEWNDLHAIVQTAHAFFQSVTEVAAQTPRLTARPSSLSQESR